MKQRLKRFLKWAAIAAGLALVVFFSWSAYYTWSTGSRLEARLAEVRSAGDPLSIADYAARPIPPETNADVPYQRIAGDVEAFQKELMTLFPKVGRATGPLTPDVQEKLGALFLAYPRVVPGLLEAAGRPDYAHDYDVSLPSTQFLDPLFKVVSRHREAGRILQSWSILLTAQGRRDEALTAQVAGLRLARHWGHDPTMIAYLTSIAVGRVAMGSAVEVLRAGPVSEESRRTLDAELALHDGLDGARRALKNERAYSLTTIVELSNQAFWLRGWMRNTLLLTFLDFYDDQLRNLDLRIAQVRTNSTPARTPTYWHPLKSLVTLLEPAMASLRDAAERQRAASRSLRVLNALQAHAPVDATTPPNLEDLGLPLEATLDPYTDEPLIVKKLPAGWLVYSVGPNVEDDGGELDKDLDVGFEAEPPAR